jgi:hypothetical protein
MIAGRVPFDGPNFVTIFDQHLETLPARLDVVTSTCPKPLADLVEHLLKKPPEMRPENAAEVARRLEEMLAEEAAAECAASSDDKGTVLASGIRENRLNLTQRLRSGPSAGAGKPNWRALAIAVGLVALVIGAVLALQGGK